MTSQIVVVGAGPAGIITAMGLVKLGYQVKVFGKQRSYAVTEGLSLRVAQALQSFECHNALRTLSAGVPRQVNWNGEKRSANLEYLVNRSEFDQALLQDAIQQGVVFVDAKVTHIQRDAGIWQLAAKELTGKALTQTADYLVDARGRAAPLANRESGKEPTKQSSKATSKDRLRGMESVTLFQNWQSVARDPYVQVVTTPDGWLWLANNGKGNLYTQVTVDAKQNTIANKSEIAPYILQLLATIETDIPEIQSLKPIGFSGARSSTPILAGDSIDIQSIRVGDAAMASDPLSGSGIFMALSSALIAPAVINTQLRRPNDAVLAMNFYQQRLELQFTRFARMGRDFYQQEQHWQDNPFWRNRSLWPDLQPTHVAQDRIIGVEDKAVVNNGWIEARQVVVTADQPLGIWKIDGRDATTRLHRSG